MPATTRAVVLARGLGSRMRAQDPSAMLTVDQRTAADAGLKAMMPIGGRPFLDHLLGALADAGIGDVALVVAPDHEQVRAYFTGDGAPPLLSVAFIVQREPLGTANALLAAETWVGRDDFLVMNADNLYPVDALRNLVALEGPGFPAFERGELVRTSNFPDERVRAFALLHIGPDGCLDSIVEKPSRDLFDRAGDRALVSLNCWRLDRRIFAACRDVPASVRGEFELPEAVGLAVSRGMKLRAVPARGPVLDLSTRADASEVARRLELRE